MPAAQPVSRRPHLANGTRYVPAAPTAANVCETPGQAIAIVQWLASIEARDGPAQDRRARAAALIGWISDYALHVEQVERGCQRLLLQAAEQVGKASR